MNIPSLHAHKPDGAMSWKEWNSTIRAAATSEFEAAEVDLRHARDAGDERLLLSTWSRALDRTFLRATGLDQDPSTARKYNGRGRARTTWGKRLTTLPPLLMLPLPAATALGYVFLVANVARLSWLTIAPNG